MAEANSSVTFRDIPGFDGYRVGDDGSVWSRRRGGWRVMKLQFHEAYVSVQIARRTVRVHRLVLLAFVGPCPAGMEGCHNDGNPRNNHRSNLRWDTPKSNAADTLAHGTVSRGESRYNARLTAEAVVFIRTEHAAGRMTKQELAAKYGVPVRTVGSVLERKSWAHVA